MEGKDVNEVKIERHRKGDSFDVRDLEGLTSEQTDKVLAMHVAQKRADYRRSMVTLLILATPVIVALIPLMVRLWTWGFSE